MKHCVKHTLFGPYECIHGTVYMHYKCQINAWWKRCLPIYEILSIWNDPQRDENIPNRSFTEGPRGKRARLDGMISDNKDIAFRLDNANEFWTHSEACFPNVTPGYLRSSASSRMPTERLVIFSLWEKQNSLLHFIGHHRDQYEPRLGEYLSARSTSIFEEAGGKKEGMKLNFGRHRWTGTFMVEAPAGMVPPAQTPFVCQATKLIEIKAGSCWPGIIKSLTNTNNVETGIESEGCEAFWGLWPRSDVSDGNGHCVNNLSGPMRHCKLSLLIVTGLY